MSKLNWKKVIGWAVAAAVVVGVVGFNMHQQQALQNSDKKIVYAILPLSGQIAQYGKDMQKRKINSLLIHTPQKSRLSLHS